MGEKPQAQINDLRLVGLLAAQYALQTQQQQRQVAHAHVVQDRLECQRRLRRDAVDQTRDKQAVIWHSIRVRLTPATRRRCVVVLADLIDLRLEPLISVRGGLQPFERIQ